MKKPYLLSILLLALALAVALIPWPAGKVGGAPVVTALRAEQYAYDPAVVTVSRGQQVVIELISTDVVHGIYLDGYELEATADPGETVRLSFKADKAGTFRFRCSVTCGPLHPFMLGELRVKPAGSLGRIAASGLLAVASGMVWSSRRETH